MKVHIHSVNENGEKLTGCVYYDPKTKDLLVTHPDTKIRKSVHSYLTNPRVFQIPSGNQVLGHQPCRLTPSDSISHMMKGLSSMGWWTDTQVDWGHKDNDFKDANKSIVKSLNGVNYEIVEVVPENG